jgi:phosphoglycolate phosphatase/pyrophosphatase PpaX
MLRYRCLILDHDDTAVNSSATIHHPAHLESMRELRPDRAPLSLDDWFRKNFEPGIMAFLRDEIGLSEAELVEEHAIWRRYTTSITPRFYHGFLEVLARYREAGGLITVVSHSEADVILGHYGALQPDAVYGWDDDAARRKPSPWPVEQILTRFELEPGEALIVDDLKPGVLMSQRSGVPIAAAGWGHRVPEIERYMRASCVAYLEEVSQLAALLAL